MSDAGVLTRPRPLVPFLVAAAALFALAVGLAIGDPASGMIVPVAAVLTVVLLGSVLVRPFAGFLVLAFSCFLLAIILVPGTHKGINAFDLVTLPVVVVTLLGRARRDARAADAREVGAGHDAVRRAADRFGRATVVYFGLAALSVVGMTFRIGGWAALNSGLSLARALQGALLFPLGLWWLRGGRRVEVAVRVVSAAALILVVVNAVGGSLGRIPRAGMVWMLNDLREPVGSPNEAAAGLLIVWTLLQARHAAGRGTLHVILMALILVMLPLTQSRSGLLAFATYLLLTVRHVRWRWVLGGVLVLLLALPLVPAPYWERIGHSLALRRGSFELFSLLIRVYGYRTAWHVFLDNPLLGVGYLGFRFVSARYNEMHLIIGQVENYFLETLVGLGVVGFAVLMVLLQRLYAVGRAVRGVSPAGSLAHEMARRHGPLLTALLVANLTGDNFTGMAGIGQLAVWCALLVRAGHAAAERGEAA